jgi:hypothetical protein
MITEERAAEIARDEMTRQGRTVSDYDMTTVPGDADQPFRLFWFEKKGPFRIPGGRHCVRVDKATGAATFMQGE